MRCVLRIDTSTTATVAGDGAAAGVGAASYGFDSPRPQWSEQAWKARKPA